MEERQLSLFGAETGQFLQRVDKDILSGDLVYSAYRGISMSPDDRVQSVRQGFADHINSVADTIEKKYAGVDEEMRDIIAMRFSTYVDKSVSLYSAYLSALSRCLSPMITGRGGFNFRRNQKRNDTADRRMNEYSTYMSKAEHSMMNLADKIRRNSTAEQRKAFLMDIAQSVQWMNGPGVSRPLFVSSIKGKLDTLWSHNNFDLFNETLTMLKRADKEKGIKVFAANNGIWERHAGTPYDEIKKPKELDGIEGLCKLVNAAFDSDKDDEYIQTLVKKVKDPILLQLGGLFSTMRYRSLRLAMQTIKNTQDAIEIELVPESSRYWQYLEYELPISNEEQGSEKREGGTIYKCDGIEVVNDLDEERVQLYFDEKPSEELRSYLKHNAFKWSNRFGAWQRQNTHAAIRVVKEFLQKYFPDALNYKPEEESGEEKPEATPTPEPAKPKKPYEKPEMREAKFKQGDHVTFETSEMDYRGVIKKVEYRKPEGFLYTVHVKDDYGEEDIIVEEDALTLAKPRKPYKKPTMTEKTPLYNIGDVVLFQRGQGGAQFAKKERAVILKAKWYEPKRCYMFDVRTDKGEEEIFATQIVSRGPVFNIGDDAYLADGRHVVIRRWRRIETNEEVDFIYSVVCDNGEVYDMTYESDLQKTGPVLEPVSYTKEQLRNIKDPVLKIGDMFVGFEPRDGYIVGWVVIDAKSEKNGDYYDHFYFVRAIAFGYEKNWQGDFRKLDKMRNHMCRKSGYTMGLNDEDIQYWYYHDATHLDKNYEYLVVKLDGESDFIKQKGNLLLLQNTIAAEKWVNERIKK